MDQKIADGVSGEFLDFAGVDALRQRVAVREEPGAGVADEGVGLAHGEEYA